MLKNLGKRRLILIMTMAAAVAGRPAFAGPPILHHPLDIGQSRSLPWNHSAPWYEGDRQYDIHNLVTDTEALLTPSMPVIVRMETLRRAAVYATRDATVAHQLLTRILSRLTTPQGEHDALAWFDAAYVTAAFREFERLSSEPQFRIRAEAVRDLTLAEHSQLIHKALALRPQDPNIAFGAAVIAAGHDRDAMTTLAARAKLGAQSDRLLAANLDILH
jgi:hypothetical protein